MYLTKRLIAILLCALLHAPIAMAQDRKAEPQSNRNITPISEDVTIIVQQRQARFTAQKAIEQMQLQVFDQWGEVVFDSGPVIANEINWPFQNATGETIKSGLYAYALSIKETGMETTRVRRGHFIVDRAKDRDGADRLWVTSQDNTGVGAELIMARDEDGVIAGTTSNGGRTFEQRTESQKPEAGERGVETETLNQTTDTKTPTAITAGTGGQIAKFTSFTDLGNSVMTELNGNIGLGTTIPSGRLHIVGSADLAGTLRFQPDASKGSSQSHVHWGSTGDWYIRSAAATGKVVLQDTGGNVAIGTSSPTSSRLTIEGQNALSIQGYEPFATFADLNSPDLFSHRFQSAHGDLTFFQGYRPPNQIALQWNPVMIIKPTGNVGLGTPYPQAKLHVAGSFLRVDGAGDEQAYLGGDGYGSDVQLGSSNPNITNVALWNSASGKNMSLFVSSLIVTGGADFAENFDINAATASEMPAKVDAGMVVSIDPANPGKLRLSTQAYDRRVAGIISGAGGVKPGMMMGQDGTLADGQHPVALTGRVYCWADASQGAIEPGDLLTTSSVPGHATKAIDPVKAHGAIIGKAMTGLKEGKGLVLVLVTLQ